MKKQERSFMRLKIYPKKVMIIKIWRSFIRTNAQSRVFEESFMIKNIPYRIVGGTNFYQRKEVKDILSYLKVVDNGLDDLAVRRIINVPRRGIGAATIEKINVYAVEHNISF